ncbi:MAG: uracil-DNA glycosylase [Campylobacterota bacterium]
MKNLINTLRLKRLQQLKNLGYNYTDLIQPHSDQNIDHELPGRMTELEQTVAQCHLCQLSKTRTHTVFGEGDTNADLVFVGEAPGQTEDNTGRPFVGRAGQLLSKMIENVLGLQRQQVYIANILKCRPPGNATPTHEQIFECKPYLDKQLELIRPKLVVALGATAFNALTGQKTALGKARGEIVNMPRFQLIASYHPSYLLRNPSMKKESYKDLLKIKSLICE